MPLRDVKTGTRRNGGSAQTRELQGLKFLDTPAEKTIRMAMPLLPWC
jgi:hypothetical protein